jgi:cysteinyl-tRNA synthetase
VSLRLFDTATREVRDFVSLVPGKAGVYVCGLTVQSEPHVGHVRSAVNFDVLRRWLIELDYDVSFIRNVTDIDDKILSKSADQQCEWYELAQVMHRKLTQAMDSLNVLPPTYEPLATGHVPEMVELIEKLIARGHAYPASDGSGDVYFDVHSFAEYGALTRQALVDMEPAEDADPRGKRDPRDFALWKGWKLNEPVTASWPSPWGRGRPGWHIECSAMAGKYLGSAFDIHGGGVDLRFPHHENEQAQSRAAGQQFANFWLHNAWITTAGEKMSKSLGNSLLIPEVLKRVRGVELRFYLVAMHYRSHVEFSFEALEEAAAGFRRIEGFLDRAAAIIGDEVADDSVQCEYWASFAEALNNDLATPAAVAVIYEAVRAGNGLLGVGDSPALRGLVLVVRRMLAALGLDPADPGWGTGSGNEHLTKVVEALVSSLLADRQSARKAKDWARADVIREQLTAAGVAIEDTPTGPKWSV